MFLLGSRSCFKIVGPYLYATYRLPLLVIISIGDPYIMIPEKGDTPALVQTVEHIKPGPLCKKSRIKICFPVVDQAEVKPQAGSRCGGAVYPDTTGCYRIALPVKGFRFLLQPCGYRRVYRAAATAGYQPCTKQHKAYGSLHKGTKPWFINCRPGMVSAAYNLLQAWNYSPWPINTKNYSQHVTSVGNSIYGNHNIIIYASPVSRSAHGSLAGWCGLSKSAGACAVLPF